MSQTTSGGGIPPAVNNAMKFILRSPIHGLISKNILLITFTGRKSGKTYTTPVSYSQAGDQVFIFTHATWWKNLHSDMPVSLRIRGRDVQGLPETISDDKKAVATGLMEHLRRTPYDARFYGVTLDENKNPNPAEVEVGAQTTVMIRVAVHP